MLPVPRLSDARPAGWDRWWQEQCRKAKKEQQKVQLEARTTVHCPTPIDDETVRNRWKINNTVCSRMDPPDLYPQHGVYLKLDPPDPELQHGVYLKLDPPDPEP